MSVIGLRDQIRAGISILGLDAKGLDLLSSLLLSLVVLEGRDGVSNVSCQVHLKEVVGPNSYGKLATFARSHDTM